MVNVPAIDHVSIIIDGSIELGLGRQAWVDISGAEEVEGGGALGNKSVPEVDRKIGIRAA